MAKIKIAHLVRLLGLAGKEKGILQIVSKMDTSRFDVDIIVLNRILEEEILDLKERSIIPMNGKYKNSLMQIPQLTEVLRKNRYDILYTHSWNTLLEGFIAGNRANVAIKIHGEHGTFERSSVKDKLQPFVWKRFEALTVVAADLADKMRDIFGYKKSNIHVLYNGIDRKKYYPSSAIREKFRNKNHLKNNFVVGTLGRFHPVKDHFTLIRGFAHFRKKYSTGKLVFVGGEKEGGTYQQQYEALIKRLNIKDDVLFLPFTPYPQDYLNALDVFVLSSVSEGCSNVILEAMACAVPVVATRTGGNPELIQPNKNGFLFEVGDDKALGDYLEMLYLKPELRKSFSQSGTKIINEKFTLENTVSNYEQLYLSLYQQKMGGKST